MNLEDEVYYLQAMKVDFLETKEERRCYAMALKGACEWGQRIDRQSKRKSLNKQLRERYNV